MTMSRRHPCIEPEGAGTAEPSEMEAAGPGDSLKYNRAISDAQPVRGRAGAATWLRACWTTDGPVGWAVTPARRPPALELDAEQHTAHGAAAWTPCRR
jgi:hypothetical protein